jgi:aminoglycoside phosphotransferase
MLKGFVNGDATGTQFVGASDKKSGYSGPVAQVYADKDWLWIVTDDYEGVAMLNIEALPHLRRALTRLAKTLNPHE